jgi:hypothetical protein
MFSKIRKQLTFANVALTVALVFAMTGGAYAASKYLITSTKQISPKVLKVLAGKPGAKGAAGASGPAGPAGAKGETGATGKEGSSGKDGANGESVSVKEVKTSEAACEKHGGSSFAIGGTTTRACNGKEGKEGSPWTAGGTLPSEKSETGTYAVRRADGALNEIETTAVSFNIPVASPPETFFVKVGEALPAGCKGSAEKPEALPGDLCIFEGEASLQHKGGLNFYTALSPVGGEVGTTGAELLFTTRQPATVGEEVSAEGTWAITAK